MYNPKTLYPSFIIKTSLSFIRARWKRRASIMANIDYFISNENISLLKWYKYFYLFPSEPYIVVLFNSKISIVKPFQCICFIFVVLKWGRTLLKKIAEEAKKSKMTHYHNHNPRAYNYNHNHNPTNLSFLLLDFIRKVFL